MDKLIYQTTAINKDGSTGYAYIKDGLSVKTSSIYNNEDGTNPEQLIGLSWATCLHSTLKTILKAKNYQNESEVRVNVSLKHNKELKDFYFVLEGFVEIKGLDIESMIPLINEADSKCPVSKLLFKEGNNVSLTPTIFNEDL